MGELDESIVHWLHRASQAADDVFSRQLGETKLTPRQFAVLASISQKGGLSQADVSDLTGIDRSTMADILRRLQSSGLVVRRRKKEDARVYEVTITPEGTRALEQANKAALRAEECLLSGLPATTAKELLSILCTLVNTRKDSSSEASTC